MEHQDVIYNGPKRDKIINSGYFTTNTAEKKVGGLCKLEAPKGRRKVPLNIEGACFVIACAGMFRI